MVDDRKQTSARKVRSPFGTQVARKIKCSSCGALDTIHFSPRPDQRILCRKCAADELGVIDREANITPEARTKCQRCGLFLKKICKHEDPLDCMDYARSLAMNQGKRAKGAIRGANGVVRVRKSSEQR